MKATELQLGNLVLLGDKIIRVYAIHKRKVGYHVRFDKLNFVFEDSVQPIPLTPEILEKNGFEEDDYYLQYTLYLDNKRAKSRSIVIIPQDDDWNEIDLIIHNQCAEINIQIQYVHELQNAMTLCKIEKEIEL